MDRQDHNRTTFFSDLEYSLLHTDFKQQPSRLGHLLSEDLVEISPQGHFTSRAEIIEWLMNKPSEQRWQLSDVKVTMLSETLALVCYQANSIKDDCVKLTGTLHSSIWCNHKNTSQTNSDENWKLAFHQATPN